MKRDRPPFRVEPLESRALPSASPLAVLSASVPVQVAASSKAPVLAGTIRGTYTVQPGAREIGPTLRLTGSGLVQGLGRVQAQGSLTTVGFVATGRARGTLTLANAEGSVVLSILGPPQAGFSVPPPLSHYEVRSATGAFAHLTGGGTVRLGLRPTATAPPGQAGSPATSAAGPRRGTFILALHPLSGRPTVTSGISGVALAGPISPVERPGVPNNRPLPGAIITVQPAGGGREIARVTADATGHFRLALRPGSYRIVPLPPRPGQFLPRGIPQDVVVHAHEVVDVTVHYDTGIR